MLCGCRTVGHSEPAARTYSDGPREETTSMGFGEKDAGDNVALPGTLWESILGHVDAQGLASLSSTSRDFHQLASDDFVWRAVYEVRGTCGY